MSVGRSYCGIPLGRTNMKTAFGILALYLTIPLAIVAAQEVIAHETAVEQNAAHAIVARALPAAPVVTKH
jgi:hypothetical protein